MKPTLVADSSLSTSRHQLVLLRHLLLKFLQLLHALSHWCCQWNICRRTVHCCVRRSATAFLLFFATFAAGKNWAYQHWRTTKTTTTKCRKSDNWPCHYAAPDATLHHPQSMSGHQSAAGRGKWKLQLHNTCTGQTCCQCGQTETNNLLWRDFFLVRVCDSVTSPRSFI